MKDDDKALTPETGSGESGGETVSHGRRDAVTKLAYASPVVATLLFTGKSAHAQSSPTPPPPPPPPNP